MLFRIAFRYVRFLGPFGAVQRIGMVSMLAMAIGTAALVIVLSVFNGFEQFIKQLYTDYYPDIVIVPKQGKTIPEAIAIYPLLRQEKNIAAVARVAEEKALLAFDQQQAIATLKGVDDNYAAVINMQAHMPYGVYDFSGDSSSVPMLMGIQLANRLGVSHESVLPLTCYTFSNQTSMALPSNMPAYNTDYGTVRGLFVIDEQVDRQVVLVPLWFIQQKQENTHPISAFEIKLRDKRNTDATIEALKKIPSLQACSILPREAQNPSLYKVLNSERWAVMAILSFMLLIASFTIISALSMLVIEKQKDIAMLKALGMNTQQIRGLFLRTGMLLSGLGGSVGMILAYGLCLGQQHFGWIRMGSSPTMRLDAYPVAFRFSDAIWIVSIVIVVAFMASWIPANNAARRPVSLRAQ